MYPSSWAVMDYRSLQSLQKQIQKNFVKCLADVQICYVNKSTSVYLSTVTIKIGIAIYLSIYLLLFIYLFRLCWVFVAASGLSLVATSGLLIASLVAAHGL